MRHGEGRPHLPKINWITYNGTKSTDLGVFVSGSGTFDAAEIDVDRYEIPGRNGDLIVPKNRYKNITITYPAFVPKWFQARSQAIRGWLRSATNYVRLEDSYDTDHFRLAIAEGIQAFKPLNQNEASNFEMSFNCKPQRFLNSGEESKQLPASGGRAFGNPTNYDALPLIVVQNPSSGESFTINGATITCLSSYTGTVYIDSETQNIYSGSTNLNSYFSGTFPVFKPGAITVTGGGMSGEIFPRWWEL